MRSHLFHMPRLTLLLAAVAAVASAVHAQWCYGWANQPAAASYQPDPKFSRNSANQPIQIAHLAGAGHYLVRFGGLGATSAPASHVQVSATTPAKQCKAEIWNAAAPDLLVKVLCFTANGTAANSGFMVLALRSQIAEIGRAHV